MTTPNVLTGGETVFGTAFDNTGTDQFLVYGASNTIIENGGNLDVAGGNLSPYGWDTNTTINLGAAYAVNDQIKLDGAWNVITGLNLVDSTINYSVSGSGASHPGHNTVTLDNSYGATSVSLKGTYNNVTLNGDATNTIATGGGDAIVQVGSLTDDDLFGFTTALKLGGSHNTVTGGDESFTITGGVSSNTIALGDGTNTVTLKGVKNSISVWGGTNTITAGSGQDTVVITGTDGQASSGFIPDPDDPMAGPPTDTVNLAGSNDAVTASYENVVVNGGACTGSANVNLGNGNNTINLGGDANVIALGYGTNAVFLTGNWNSVSVADPNGVGTDNVTIGNGSGDQISFAYAGGSVNGTGSGTTTVTQAAAAWRVLNVNLGPGTGLISLGQGSDTVAANGAGTSIYAGNGNDLVSANGSGAIVTLGNGNDTVYANGSSATVTLGNGNNYVQANGNNALVTLGAGSNTVQALGSGSAVYIAAGPTSLNNVTVGSSDLVRILGGTADVLGNAGNSFYFNGLLNNSQVTCAGNGNMVFIGSDSSMDLFLNQAQNSNAITVQADIGNTFGGFVDLSYFNPNDSMTLSGMLGGIDGHVINSFAEVIDNMTSGPTGATLHLGGGGSILFSAVTGFTSGEFHFTSTTGPI